VKKEIRVYKDLKVYKGNKDLLDQWDLKVK
jgi:hypothetical protein